jgi:hypothetical protein
MLHCDKSAMPAQIGLLRRILHPAPLITVATLRAQQTDEWLLAGVACVHAGIVAARTRACEYRYMSCACALGIFTLWASTPAFIPMTFA